jgi:predicted phage tail protein
VIAVAAATTGADRTTPTITRLRSRNRRFSVGPTATATIARAKRKPAPHGTAFEMTLSEPATVVIAIARAGHATSAALTLVRPERRAGSLAIAFSGRIGSTRLRPGAYTATVRAIDASGNRSKSATTTFTVVTK